MCKGVGLGLGFKRESIRARYKGCHTPIPGPTRLADPNRVRGARPYTGTLYLIFFSKAELVPVGYGPTSYNIIKISYTYQKNYHWSGVHQNLYTSTESHLQIQNYTFTFTIRARNLHVVNPYKCVGPAVCGCFRRLLLYLHGLKTRAKLYA